MNKTETAIFASGCFWCTQSDFDKVPGVVKTTVGYTGGKIAHPTYEQVSQGGTGHVESLQVLYNPDEVSYQKLLEVFWHSIDPTNAMGQFCDIGPQYRSVIFYHNDIQKKLAEESKLALVHSQHFKNIATEILPEKTFYPAEDYHQKYYIKNPVRYKFYRYSCGRDAVLKKLWDKS